MAYVLQDPDEALTHSVDWNSWLASGDTLSSATWAISPSTGVTLADLGESSGVASVKVSGLTYGQIYNLTCSMVSTNGETGQQTVTIRCGHK